MDTYYASPERTDRGELENEIELISTNPVMDGLLTTTNGLLAILNENRQIISANHSLMSMLGIENPEEVLGLRPGEAVKCIHVSDSPNGCGTSKFCST